MEELAIAATALGALRELFVEELSVGVRKPLNRIHRLLNVVNRRQDELNSESVQLFLRQLQDLVIDAEQLFEKYAPEVMARRERADPTNSLANACIPDERVMRLKDMLTTSDEEHSKSVRGLVRELQDLAIGAEQVLEIYEAEVMPIREGINLLNSLKRFTCVLGKCVSMRRIRKKAGGILSLMENLTNTPVGASSTQVELSTTDGASSNLIELSTTDGASLTQVELSKTDGISSTDDVGGQFKWLMKMYGHKFGEIMYHLEDLAIMLECLGIDEDQIECSRTTYGLEVKEHFVGREDDLERLTSLVTSDRKSNRVISICGMGGVGKTTLAAEVYQDGRVQSHFAAKAWITVSSTFSPRAIFQELLKQLLHKEKLEDLSEDELGRQLFNIQKEKKCLVVLDDVWETDNWGILERAFPIKESRSTILITSRNQDVAATAHVLKPLAEAESWELFRRIALPTSDSHGKQIVRECCGLPLWVSLVGGILLGETNLREWDKALYFLKYMRPRGALELSYNALPFKLKPCFLHLGFFEKDELIDMEQLYLIWMAEGLILSEDKGIRETLRDVAERYLHELVGRRIIHMRLDESRGIYVKCQLHDLVREFCLSIAREGFLGVLSEDSELMSNSFHRLAIYSGVSNYALRWGNPHLQGLKIQKNNTVLIGNDLGRFKYLRFLILEELEFKDRKLPPGVDKLIFLKHLRIYNCSLDTLPKAVCKLPRLQSLHLELRGLQIPNLVCKMRHLTYLYFDTQNRSTIGSRKLDLEGLNKLETLLGFNSNFDNIEALIRLYNLRTLRGLVNDEKSLRTIVDHNMSQFHNVVLNVECSIEDATLLKKMIQCMPITELCVKGILTNLPAYDPLFGKNLATLTLVGCKMMEDPMRMLEKLPVLKVLRLEDDSFLGEEMICMSSGFHRLTRLYLSNLSNLQAWKVEKNAMHHLSYLQIRSCTKLEMIPDGLQFITSLAELQIIQMPREFVSRLREGEADYHKIKHVPPIKINICVILGTYSILDCYSCALNCLM